MNVLRPLNQLIAAHQGGTPHILETTALFQPVRLLLLASWCNMVQLCCRPSRLYAISCEWRVAMILSLLCTDVIRPQETVRT
jgi:hypothetical protein